MLKLIINADDYGISKGTNEAIAELVSKRKLSSTTVMVNMPYYDEIKNLESKIGIGLHLNLTQGKPVTTPSLVWSLVNKDGEFWPFRDFRKRLLSNKIKSRHLQLEINNQFKMLYDVLPGHHISHWDSHQGIHRFPGIIGAAVKIGDRFGVKKFRTHKHVFMIRSKQSHLLDCPLKNVFFYPPKRILTEIYYLLLYRYFARKYKTPDFNLGYLNGTTLDAIAGLSSLNTNVSYCIELACHPATTVKGLPQTKLLSQRVEEYNLLREVSFGNNIQLINYNQI